MAGLTPASREFLENETNKTKKKLNKAVDKLVKTLESYGLKGEIKLQLTVVAKKDGTDTVAERSCVIPYATWR